MKQNTKSEDLSIIMILNETAKLFHSLMRSRLNKLGIPAGYAHILFHLSRRDNTTQQELVMRTHLKPSTVSVTLQNLEQDGLVVRKTDEEDMRQTRVCLSEKGRQLDDTIRRQVTKTEKIILDSITGEEYRLLKLCLLKIRDVLLMEGDTK